MSTSERGWGGQQVSTVGAVTFVFYVKPLRAVGARTVHVVCFPYGVIRHGSPCGGALCMPGAIGHQPPPQGNQDIGPSSHGPPYYRKHLSSGGANAASNQDLALVHAGPYYRMHLSSGGAKAASKIHTLICETAHSLAPCGPPG